MSGKGRGEEGKNWIMLLTGMVDDDFKVGTISMVKRCPLWTIPQRDNTHTQTPTSPTIRRRSGWQRPRWVGCFSATPRSTAIPGRRPSCT